MSSKPKHKASLCDRSSKKIVNRKKCPGFLRTKLEIFRKKNYEVHSSHKFGSKDIFKMPQLFTLLQKLILHYKPKLFYDQF
jgi:hypothetical protein